MFVIKVLADERYDRIRSLYNDHMSEAFADIYFGAFTIQRTFLKSLDCIECLVRDKISGTSGENRQKNRLDDG